jgi:hypothetical protein
MRDSSRALQWSILIPLLAAVVSWTLFLAAQYSDLVVQSQLPPIFDSDTPEVLRPSIWLLFAASAVFGIGSVVAQKMAIAARARLGGAHNLARAAHRFTNLAVIVALALATVLAIGGFLAGFVNQASESSSALVRIVNVYLPIVLYTALVVTLLLAAFVLRKSALQDATDALRGTDAGSPPAAAAAEQAPHDSATPEPSSSGRGELAFAYAAPIVLTAVALILGLIVFDLTGTAPQVWVWVIIQALIGVGIVVGTVFARGAKSAQVAGARTSPTVVSGARSLNFVLSVVFAVVVTIMSLGYGSSAISQLSIAPNLWVDVYAGGAVEPGAESGSQPSPGDTIVTVSGYSLQRGSDVSVTLEPGGDELITGQADRDGAFYDQEILSGGLAAGDYTVTATGRAADGEPLTAAFDFTITEEGMLSVGPQKPDFGGYENRLIAPSAQWALNDLVPALLLLLLACVVIDLTIVARNRERRPLTR